MTNICEQTGKIMYSYKDARIVIRQSKRHVARQSRDEVTDVYTATAGT